MSMTADENLKPVDINPKKAVFRYDPKMRLFSAALQVTAKQGIRDLTIAAIATKAERAIGTVGRHKIKDYVSYVVEYCFTPIHAVCEQQLRKEHGTPPRIEKMIDAMLANDREVAPLVMQARALVACSAGAASRDGEPSLAERFAFRRRAAKNAIAAWLRLHERFWLSDVNERAEMVIGHYLRGCERLTGAN